MRFLDAIKRRKRRHVIIEFCSVYGDLLPQLVSSLVAAMYRCESRFNADTPRSVRASASIYFRLRIFC